MDKKKLLISGLTLAGFLAMSSLTPLGSVSFAEDQVPPAKETQKSTDMKSGSCGAGSCGATKDTKKKEDKKEEAKMKEGSCSGTKDKAKEGDKKEDKHGSCTAMK
ncbi:MAG: hypothetical protein HYU97_10390 [Deltaproteobacteria bacterium]|nr:hypothetical protein [Deltaproteobacteria bacterium]